MRVLFSSMRLTGHIRPLLPYAHELLRRGHEVLVSTPEKGGAIVREAGLAHALSDFPNEEDLREIWDSLPKMPPEEAGETVLTQLFAGRYPRAALPALRERDRAKLEAGSRRSRVDGIRRRYRRSRNKRPNRPGRDY